MCKLSKVILSPKSNTPNEAYTAMLNLEVSLKLGCLTFLLETSKRLQDDLFCMCMCACVCVCVCVCVCSYVGTQACPVAKMVI